MMLGEVDNVDGHYIATKFYGLCIPSSSMYVTSYSSSRSGNRTTMTWGGVPVKLNWKSILLTYPRVWLWFVFFGYPFVTHYGQNLDSLTTFDKVAEVLFVVVAIGAHFVGRLSKAEKARLRILGKVTGMRMDPKKLTKWTREEKREFWEKELGKLGVPTTPDGLRAFAASAPPDVLGVLYTFACYSGDGPDWRGVAAEILPRVPEVPKFMPPIPNIR